MAIVKVVAIGVVVGVPPTIVAEVVAVSVSGCSGVNNGGGNAIV